MVPGVSSNGTAGERWHVVAPLAGDRSLRGQAATKRLRPALRDLDFEVWTQREQGAPQASRDERVVVHQQYAPPAGNGLWAGGGHRRRHELESLQVLGRWYEGPACARSGTRYRRRQMEPGLVTLAKIVGTLLACMGIIPILFLLSGGDMTEPEDRLDSEHKS